MPGYAFFFTDTNHYEDDILAMEKNLLLFLLLSAVLYSCGSNSSERIDYDILSQQYCACGQPSIEVSNQMQVLILQNELDEIKKLASKASQAFNEAVECSKIERQKFANQKLDKQVLGRKLKNNCPDMPAKFISNLLEKIN